MRIPDRVPIVVGASAEAPVRYAAREAKRVLDLLTRGDHAICGACSAFCLSFAHKEGLEDGFEIRILPAGIRIAYSLPAGAVYGVYALLEKLGCRFFAQDCERIPQTPSPLPDGAWEERPSFRVRELFYREAMDGAFAVRLRLNSARSTITPEMGGKVRFYNFSHTFNRLVPPDVYYDAHPEYFSMVAGQRLRERSQLCLTNPEVKRICIEGVKKWKRENPSYRVFSVSMNDWYNPCECPSCRAVDREEGSASGTMIRFVNDVAEAVEQVYPDIMIHTFAYLYCRKPPRYTRPRHNVIVRLCPIESCRSHALDACAFETGRINVQTPTTLTFSASAGENRCESDFLRDLRGWSAITENLFIWDYTVNYANYLQPLPNLGSLQANLRLFKSIGVKGVFEQGNFSLGRSGALGPLKIYLLAKLMWNVDADADALTDDFCHGYFGNGGDAMLAYAKLFYSADAHASIYDAPNAAYLTEDLLSEAERLLETALSKTDGVEHERVEREALSIAYVRLAREDISEPGHMDRVDAFGRKAAALGITELFERKTLESSLKVLKTSRYALDRQAAESISYPI